MRNPNYKYEANGDGWTIYHGDPTNILSPSTWGKTKAAARSRLLRMLKHNAKLTATQANQEEANDQSE